MADVRAPQSTYRIQFHGQFGFQQARAIVPYLRQLGVTDLYASPILRPRRGSMHGYDGVDPTQLNPELGSDADFDALSAALRDHEMGLLLDIVPNHMAASPQNPWWRDVLEKGSASRYARFFDIDWRAGSPGVGNKLLLPILGKPYGEVLEARELQLQLEDDGIYLDYYDTRLPLDLHAWAMIATPRADGADAPNLAPLRALLQAIDELPSDPLSDLLDSLKAQMLQAMHTSAAVRDHLAANIDALNSGAGDSLHLEGLDALLAQQAYQLAYWQTATERINYRRFFDISDLAGMRAEDEQVFAAMHALVLQLIAAKQVTGLRIDHIDGLYDPLAYLNRLQSQAMAAIGASGESRFYVVAEKILTGSERLPAAWPIAGTTGYDFLNALNRVFIDCDGFARLRDDYQQWVASDQSFHNMVYDKKKQVMADLFASEVRSLSQMLADLASRDPQALDLSFDQLRAALIEVSACLPVYRTYIDGQGATASDRRLVQRAISDAQQRNPGLDRRALPFLQRVLLPTDAARLSEDQQRDGLAFAMRWQQFTGPAMAKGVEDTALYNYNCLTSLNDVGGEPVLDGDPVAAFHACNQERLAAWPHTLNATSTHDTKRSEDVRARINALAEMPDAWRDRLHRWRRWNQGHKPMAASPDANTEWLIYQTLIGAWPLAAVEVPSFRDRVKAYVIKAAREAKELTSWLSPQSENEAALQTFVDAVLDPNADNLFLEDFLVFQGSIAFYGAINALSQVLLKIVSPGAPDFYQGTELWDLSLVDPDNRRPVDFDHRQELLEDLTAAENRDRHALLADLLLSWRDGRIKLYVTHKALQLRNAYPQVFQQGSYAPLAITGAKRDCIVALARQHGDAWVIAAAPRLPTQLAEAGVWPLGETSWRTDALILPHGAPAAWTNVFTGDTANVESQGLQLAELMRRFPVALLIGHTHNES